MSEELSLVIKMKLLNLLIQPSSFIAKLGKGGQASWSSASYSSLNKIFMTLQHLATKAIQLGMPSATTMRREP